MYDLVDVAFTGLLLLMFMSAFLGMLTLSSWSSPGLSMKACMVSYLQDNSLVQLLLSGKYGAVLGLARTCGASSIAIYENGVLVYGHVSLEKCDVLTSIQVSVPGQHLVYTIILCR